MFYLAVTLALSFACAAWTWFLYKIFIGFVSHHDRRRRERFELRRAPSLDRLAFSKRLPEPPAALPVEEWPELIDE